MTINVTNLPVIEGEFILKHLTIVKEGSIFSSKKFENVVVTQEEQNIIKNFNYSTYYDCGNLVPKPNLNFNSTTVNINERNNQVDKAEKLNYNNSIIYNNENGINIYNSNNENIFNKNNSFTPNFINNYANANSNTTNNVNNPNQMQQSIKATNVNLNNYLTASYNIINANPNYSFFKIVIKNMKIVILRIQDVLIAGFFSHTTSTCLIKGYLLHIYALYSNYSSDIFEIAKSKFKEGNFFTGFYKQNMYFKDNSNSTSPIRDKKDYSSNANHFILNTQGNEKNSGIKNNPTNSNNTLNVNNAANLIDLSNFLQTMNKKFFEVK